MDIFRSITWADLLVVLMLAVGALAGFTQGLLRAFMACFAVLAAFVVASQLKASLASALTFWTAFNAEVREVVGFVVLYLLIALALWLAINIAGRGARLPVARQVNEISGSLFGVAAAALTAVFLVVALSSHYAQPAHVVDDGATSGEAPALRNFYVTLRDSAIVRALSGGLVPTAGQLARPFVPDDVAEVIARP